jgi:hypothetical protein
MEEVVMRGIFDKQYFHLIRQSYQTNLHTTLMTHVRSQVTMGSSLPHVCSKDASCRQHAL